MGGGTTDLAIFTGNSLRYNAIIPVGGNNLTNDIAVGLQTSLQNAEQLKVEHGCCLNVLADQKEMVEIPGLGGRKPRNLSRFELAEIVDLRLSEVVNLIAKDIHKAGSGNPVLAGAVITGGSALVPGIMELFDDTLHLPTRIGYPIVTGGLTDVVHNPMYATGVGLVLYGYRKQMQQYSQPRRWGRRSGGKTGIWSKVKKWFQEVV
jgi:cell division protein FtsA